MYPLINHHILWRNELVTRDWAICSCLTERSVSLIVSLYHTPFRSCTFCDISVTQIPPLHTIFFFLDSSGGLSNLHGRYWEAIIQVSSIADSVFCMYYADYWWYQIDSLIDCTTCTSWNFNHNHMAFIACSFIHLVALSTCFQTVFTVAERTSYA